MVFLFVLKHDDMIIKMSLTKLNAIIRELLYNSRV